MAAELSLDVPTTLRRTHRGPTVLCWLMLLAGGAALAACLILPPWREAHELRAEHAAAEQRLAELEHRLTVVTQQVEHLRNDPSYLERLARQEFGEPPPDVDFTPLELEPAAQDPASEDAPAAAEEDTGDALEQAAQRNPIVSVFVLDETRPIVMVMSGAMMLVALVLLLRGGAPDRR